MVWIIALTALLGLYMAWNIGANDVANSMADAVGSRSISIKWAIVAAGICEFAGAVLVGSHVTETVRGGIVSPEALEGRPEVLALGMICALLGAAVWLNLATWMGMPVSTTHSIVGAVAGFGVVAAGWATVDWGKMGGIVVSWFISPVVGGTLAFAFFKLINRLILGKRKAVRAARTFTPYIVFFLAVVVALFILYKGLKHITGAVWWLTGGPTILISLGVGLVSFLAARLLIGHYFRADGDLPLPRQLERIERLFAPLVVITSCCVAFAHGSNDVANAVGPLAAVADIVRNGAVSTEAVPVPIWVLALGGIGITLGLATCGYRVMRTVGEKITQITPSRGVAADLAATITVLGCSRLGLPVSTTHTLVGAILGIGLARGLGAVNRRVTRNIFGSWLITVPAAAALSIGFFLIGRALLLGAIGEVIEQAHP